MKPTIDQVLAESNLSEAQIGQITAAVGDKLADVRSAHIEEVAAIEQSKDALIGGLMRELVENKRLLAEATKSSSVVLDEVLSVQGGALKASLVGSEIVVESKDSHGASRRVSIPLAESKELMGCALELPSLQQLDEKVVVKPRRIVATNGNSAVGIDLDVGGTLAFTVTDPEGSSLFELSRPDSEAVKDWFRMLQEASDEEEPGDADTPSDEELEERVRHKVVAEVNKLLAEALRPVAPMVRRARRHDDMRNLVEGLQAAFGKVFSEATALATAPAALQESVEAASRLETLETTNKTLAEENLTLRQQMLFAERTAGMAQTTRERVQMVVEAAHPTTLQDFSDLLEVAILSVKPAQEPAPPVRQERAPTANSSLMQSVIDKL